MRISPRGMMSPPLFKLRTTSTIGTAAIDSQERAVVCKGAEASHHSSVLLMKITEANKKGKRNKLHT